MQEVAELIIPGRRLNLTAKLGGAVLAGMFLLCLATLPWTMRDYDDQRLTLHHTPPLWGASHLPLDGKPDGTGEGETAQTVRTPLAVSRGHLFLGTDGLGRSMLMRCLLGGAISLGIGIAAAGISVVIGTAWGMVAGYLGGRTDAALMRIVDILYGLPYILLVLLLVVAVEGVLERVAARELVAMEAATAAGRRYAPSALFTLLDHNRWMVNLGSLLLALGAVGWLTLARVVRGQVLSLKDQPFVEAARAMGCSTGRILLRHLLPNLLGPIIVYTTLTVPQAILQESFLSFLGIGVKPPLPSWGNLAAEGLREINPVKSHWWLLAWPCLLLGLTLLSLNYLGDGLRDKYDPRLK